MASLSKIHPSNMFNAVKKLFGRRVEETVEETAEVNPAEAMVGYTETPASAVHHVPPRGGRVEVPRGAHPSSAGSAQASVGIPLSSILNRLPADLMQRVRQIDVGDAEVFIPTAKLLSQIGQGSAKISFGELRQLAPPGTFTAENDRDRTLIDLPLHDILARLGTSVLVRRPSQRQVEVPPEVTGPFGGQSKVTFSTTVMKKPAAPAQSNPAPAPIPVAPPAPARQAAPVQAPAQAAPRFQPAIAMTRPAQSAAAVQPVVARIRANLAAQQPAAPVQAAAPAPAHAAAVATPPAEEFVFRRAAPAPAAPAQPPVFTPISPEPVELTQSAPIPLHDSYASAASAEPITPIAPEPVTEPEPIPFNEPIPATVPMPAFAGETRFLSVPISEVYGSWPESVRGEIASHHLHTSVVGLPFGAVEGNIKLGRIAFPWKAVRTWIKPLPSVTVSQNDTVMVDFPLKVVTPLFLAELKSLKPQRKVAVDANIPNLFSDSRLSEVLAAAQIPPIQTPPSPPPPAFAPQMPSSAPVGAPAPITPVSAAARTPSSDTNYFAWKGAPEAPVEEAPVFVKKGVSPGTAFLKRYATPNDIVNKAAELDGVDGALIALPDGLLVASRIPATMNPDTIAAFLPQIFGRVSQCTRELRLGDLNNLNFTVGNIPWKIFRVGAIFFAAFGRPGEPLPSAQLASIAADLDRKAT
jgi:predicted regulator of Ras-like GTPase activity (Roadblock/LC7/MglB family)